MPIGIAPPCSSMCNRGWGPASHPAYSGLCESDRAPESHPRNSHPNTLPEALAAS